METTFIQIMQAGQTIEIEMPKEAARLMAKHQQESPKSIFSVTTHSEGHQPIEIWCPDEPNFGIFYL